MNVLIYENKMFSKENLDFHKNIFLKSCILQDVLIEADDAVVNVFFDNCIIKNKIEFDLGRQEKVNLIFDGFTNTDFDLVLTGRASNTNRYYYDKMKIDNYEFVKFKGKKQK